MVALASPTLRLAPSGSLAVQPIFAHPQYSRHGDAGQRRLVEGRANGAPDGAASWIRRIRSSAWRRFAAGAGPQAERARGSTLLNI